MGTPAGSPRPSGCESVASRQPVRLDLGCGRVKLPGFIGLDRFPLPGVDIVADLDQPLSFDDDSVDLVHASHSLEHVQGLSEVIREIYRVCKHGAQICIVAPYSQQTLNLANPYHKHAFNEHTPRFWTSAPTVPIDRAEYSHPHAIPWGLLESDNSDCDIDIRCMKMEFFYFPAYRDLDVNQQRQLRRHQFDVCDQIVYHLLVLKQPASESEFTAMTQSIELFESPYVNLRRMQDRYESLQAGGHKPDDAPEDLVQLRLHVEDLSRAEEQLRKTVSELESSLLGERRVIASMRDAAGWRALNAIHRIGRAITPPGTRRGRLAGAVWAIPRRVLRQGIRSLERVSDLMEAS